MSSLIHGLSDTKEYHAWENMKSRCMNPKNPRYSDYGGRGITILPNGKYRVKITVHDTSVHIGVYTLKAQARKARHYAELTYW